MAIVEKQFVTLGFTHVSIIGKRWGKLLGKGFSIALPHITFSLSGGCLWATHGHNHQNYTNMGLFSFLKNAGASLFGGKKEEKKATPATPTAPSAVDQLENSQMAMRLTNHVVGLGLKVENLSIVVDDDKATITGEAASQSEKEKVILAVGNVAGIATVDDWMTVAAPPTPEAAPEPEAVFYTVVKGDNLSKIAKAHYGNAMKYPVIFEANKPMLKDPDLIYPGQVLRIPPLA